mgnify:CR=1 FL=1
MAATITINNFSLTVPVKDGPGNPRDFVGLYRTGAANNAWLTWKYLANNNAAPVPKQGVKTGTVSLVSPGPSGSYEVRFISINPSGDEGRRYVVVDYIR